MLERARRLVAMRLSAATKVVLDDKVFVLLYLALCAVYLAPVLLLRHLPMQDGPAHLALVQIWRHLDGDGVIAKEYVARGGMPPYVTYYTLLRLLGGVWSLQTANRIILAAYVVSLPLAVAYLATRFGRDRRYGLLAFPLIYNTPFVYGFTSNVVALPIFVVTIALLKEYLDRPKWTKELGLALLVILLYFSHVLVAAAFAVGGPIVFFAQVHHPLRVLRRCVFALPALVIALLWSRGQTESAGFDGQYLSVSQNMTWLLSWTNDVQLGSVDEVALLVLGATLVLCTIPRAQAFALPRAHWSVALAALGVLALFFVAPAHTTKPLYHWATNVRLVVPALLLLLVVPKAQLRGVQLGLVLPALAFFAHSGISLFQSFSKFDAEVRHLDAVVSVIPENRRVLPLIFDQSDGLHQGYPMRNILLTYQAQKPGYMPEGLVSDNTPIAFRTHRTPGPFYKTPSDFRYSAHGRYYHYYLAGFSKVQQPPETLPHADGNVRLLKRSGRFAVYENVGTLPAD
jgi:hypothetical protein